MTHAEKGAKGGAASGEARMVKGMDRILACRTKRELIEAVIEEKKLAYMRGWQSGRRAKVKAAKHDWLGV